MAKSIDEYYSEKMKKLLDMQKRSSSPQLPAAFSEKAGTQAQGRSQARNYYDSFRSKVEKAANAPREASPQKRHDSAEKNPLERTVIDDIREGKPIRRPVGRINEERQETPPKGNPPGEAKNARKRTGTFPEQTMEDRQQESARKIEAMQTAKKARTLRNIRDVMISVGLILAVLVVMCIVAYRLLFVINDISVKGAAAYTTDAVLGATGVHKGDHLYSFSSREVGELLILRCPEISSVDVERTPPGKIEFNVTEEKAAFYADFYGEFRLLSPTLRVLGSVTEEDAKAMGCIKLVLPDVSNVTAGLVPEFAEIRDDEYIYDICDALLNSNLGKRAGRLDLSDKYDITLTIDARHLVSVGDSDSIDTKLKIATAVLKDEMFEKDIKTRIDVSDLSETSVVVDEGLSLE